MTEPMTQADRGRITVWYCDTCGYWRQERSSRVHQTNNPDDLRGRMVLHDLREVEYVPAASLAAAEKERDAALVARASFLDEITHMHLAMQWAGTWEAFCRDYAAYKASRPAPGGDTT